MPIWFKDTPTGLILNLYCQPGAKQTRVVGLHNGALKISLKAPALENKANELLTPKRNPYSTAYVVI